MRIMRLAVVVLTVLCGIATAGSKQPETFDVWLRAGVDIDETGHVQDLQWEEQSEVHALIAERLAPIVRRWEFEPATIDGRPKPTQTGLLIHILGDELADGSVVLRLSDAQAGPTALSLTPPAYPMDAVRSGVTALVRVTVEVNADGSPTISEVTYEGSPASRSAYHSKAFVDSATKAVMQWKFRPELVAGKVVSGPSIRIPINYCLSQTESSVCNDRQSAGEAERKLPVGLHIGDSSAVVLKTEIREQVI
jgi:TonB family protein